MDMKRNKKVFLFSLLTTLFLLVFFALFYRKFFHRNYSSSNYPNFSQITEEKAREEILKEFSDSFQETPENLESNLQHLAQKTNFLESKDISTKELSEKLEAELKKK